MKSLIEALIGKNNINNAFTLAGYRCVFVSDDRNPNHGDVWVLLSANEIKRRLDDNEFYNATLKSMIKNSNIKAYWICPAGESQEHVYARAATGDIKKDFKSLYDSRDIKPTIKEFKPIERLTSNMKILDYYEKENWFLKEISKIK